MRWTVLCAFLPTLAVGEPDCVCKESWEFEKSCDNGERRTFHGCPELAELASCRSDIKVRTCTTTEQICAQQSGTNINSQAVDYCNILNPAERKEVVPNDLGDWCSLQRFNAAKKLEKYDLTPLQKNPLSRASYRDTNYKFALRGAKGNDDQDYFINVCGPLANFQPPAHWDTAANGLVAAWEENPGNSNRSHVLASVIGASLESQRDGDLTMRMEGGSACRGVKDPATGQDKKRRMVIAFTCADVGLGQGPDFLAEIDTCEYMFTWQSCAACPLGHAFRSRACGPGTANAPMTLPPTSTLVLVLLVLFSIYCFVGCCYNRVAGGKQGMEQVPNAEFWACCCDVFISGPQRLFCGGGGGGGAKPSTVSHQLHSGLIDDDDDDVDEDDAEDRLYD